MQYFISAFSQYVDFSGRTSRKAYWMFVLFYVIFYIAVLMIDSVLGTVLFSGLYSLILFLPTISIGVRRLHDTGRSGWWMLLALIPIIGTIVLVIFLIGGSQNSNQYGPAPID